MVDREEKDSAQKAKLIFLTAAAIIVVVLLAGIFMTNKVRAERDAAYKELDLCKQDNAKLTQFLDEQTKEVDKPKKQLETCEAKAKAKAKAKPKAKPAAKSKSPAKSTAKKKKKTK